MSPTLLAWARNRHRLISNTLVGVSTGYVDIPVNVQLQRIRDYLDKLAYSNRLTLNG